MFRSCVAAAAVALACSVASATPLIVQPDEAASKDVLIYQFLGNMNLEAGFSSILGSGNVNPGHEFASLIQFELPPGTQIGVNEQATLHLYVRDPSVTMGFGEGPSPAYPVTANFHRITGDWTESTVTWNTMPSFDSSASASIELQGFDNYISVNITSLVQGWIDNPATNFGLLIDQPDQVLGGTSQYVGAVYDAASGTNRPYLQIAAVPEPGVMALLGLAAVFGIRRRGRA